MTPLRFAVLLAATVLALTTHADPDLWGHIRFGQDILDTWSIPVADPYSFTNDRPWVNHEWLAEAVMAASYQMAGSVGLVLLKIVLVATMLAILLWSLRNDRLPTVPRDFLTFLAVAAIFSRIIPVRPQLFSLVLFCGLLALLKQSERQPGFCADTVRLSPGEPARRLARRAGHVAGMEHDAPDGSVDWRRRTAVDRVGSDSGGAGNVRESVWRRLVGVSLRDRRFRAA